MPYEFTCKTCGTPFTKRNRLSRPGVPWQFCSRTCMGMGKRGPRANVPNPIPGPDGSVLIPLSQGAFAIVDADDAERIGRHRWYLSAWGYAVRHRYATDPPGGGKVSMHREVMHAARGVIVDHIDRNRVHNRKANLRVVTDSENVMNATIRRDNTCGYKGVARHGSGWRAYIKANGVGVKLGTHRTPEEAARVRDAAARELHGEFAVLNFPDD